MTQARDFRLELFEQTAEHLELRLDVGDGIEARQVAKADVQALVEEAKRVYGEQSIAPKVFGSRELVDFGIKLHDFVDGAEGSLSKALIAPGAVLRIPISDDAAGLRHLPWELLASPSSSTFRALDPAAPFAPARLVRTNVANESAAAENRPLRVLFMATSPVGVEPVLHYEHEEAAILQAARDTGIEVVVEESGSLEGLRFLAQSYGTGYFDVLHLSGHGNVIDGQPVFLVEDSLGRATQATPQDIVSALGGLWPRLVFASGCLTSSAPDQSALPSLSSSLVEAGAPAAMGWALPVGDAAATDFAAVLYGELAAGTALTEALQRARQALYANKSTFWHYLRLYTDASPLGPLVTPKNQPGRKKLTTRPASAHFLDPQSQISRVASREEFVGRRRQIQRCLRLLNDPDGPEGLVLHGMGGLGKSTLASRLVERMPNHKPVVWFGAVDDVKLSELTTKVHFDDLDKSAAADQILAHPQADLDTKLRYLLNEGGPLADTPCLFIFDDFENGNLTLNGDAYRWADAAVGDRASALDVTGAILRAIRATGSQSRVIFTCRYQFPEPQGAKLHFEALQTLDRNELTKKLLALDHLSPLAKTDTDVRARAITAADGNPRLLEWLNRIVDDPELDAEALIDAIDGKAGEFRENILAEQLLATLDHDVVEMLARLNVIELPIPGNALRSIHDHPDVGRHIERTTQLGLLEAGPDPETNETHYYVSNVLRPLLSPRLDAEAYKEACAAAAHALAATWAPDLTAAEDTSGDQPDLQ